MKYLDEWNKYSKQDEKQKCTVVPAKDKKLAHINSVLPIFKLIFKLDSTDSPSLWTPLDNGQLHGT